MGTGGTRNIKKEKEMKNQLGPTLLRGEEEKSHRRDSALSTSEGRNDLSVETKKKKKKNPKNKTTTSPKNTTKSTKHNKIGDPLLKSHLTRAGSPSSSLRQGNRAPNKLSIKEKGVDKEEKNYEGKKKGSKRDSQTKTERDGLGDVFYKEGPAPNSQHDFCMDRGRREGS